MSGANPGKQNGIRSLPQKITRKSLDAIKKTKHLSICSCLSLPSDENSARVEVRHGFSESGSVSTSVENSEDGHVITALEVTFGERIIFRTSLGRSLFCCVVLALSILNLQFGVDNQFSYFSGQHTSLP